MKKVSILLFAGIMSCWISSLFAQTDTTITENFDGNTVSFSSTPANAWSKDNNYNESPPYSYWGRSPNMIGDSIVLTTPIYNLSKYGEVILRFKHICKISPQDITRIEYKISSQGWNPIPAAAYKGKGTYYGSAGFNASSYAEWDENDSMAVPSQLWWKEEEFDVGYLVGIDNGVQFRFIIKHGNVAGTQLSYGWLLDDFGIMASDYEKKPPVVAFFAPLVQDTVYNIGPWTINARVKTQTTARIENPWLKYTATKNGTIVANDSVLMEHVQGDTLWKGDIPQFEAGTTVQYAITGRDATSNELTVSSFYVISTPKNEQIYIQNGNTYNILIGGYPFQQANTQGGYYRNMSLYTPPETPAIGIIDAIALDVRVAASAGFPVKIWLKTVPATKTTWITTTDNQDWDVLTADAVLVYDGNIHFNTLGWFDIPLNNNTEKFVYNGTDNLVLMLEKNCGGTNCGTGFTMPKFNMMSVANTVWYKTSNNTPPTAATALTLTGYRTNLRVTMRGVGVNAAAMYSIDVADTITAKTSENIVVTIKNKAKNDLTSADIFYSVNGDSPKKYSWTGTVPWDFNKQIGIGSYKPKVNGWDTITVWIKNPNGVTDNSVGDDTVTKVVYGLANIQIEFIESPADTVFFTGLYEIKAKISSIQGASLPTDLSLYVSSTYQGVTSYDTLDMILDASDNLWKVTLPHYHYETNVVYSISLKDNLGNEVVLSNKYYINRLGNIATGSIASEYFYTGSEQRELYPAGLYRVEVWGANGGASGGNGVAPGGIGGYSVGTIRLTTPTVLYINVGEVGLSRVTTSRDETGRVPGGYNGGGASGFGNTITQIVGSGGGATHIAKRTGILSALASFKSDVIIVAGGGGGAGGGTSPFNGTSFTHSGGDGGGSSGKTGGWAVTTRLGGSGGTQIAGGIGGMGYTEETTAATAGSFGIGGSGGGARDNAYIGGGGGGGWYGGGGGNAGGAAGGGGSGYIKGLINPRTAQSTETGFIAKPNTTDGNGYVKITPVYSISINDSLKHSVALEAINSIDAETVIANSLTPVLVTIRNSGLVDLDSCYIHWSLNGTIQPGTVYKGKKLKEDFTDTITIGNYTPVYGLRDTITVWVSMPNGQVDTVTFDDTLTVTPVGCVDWGNGIKNIPGDFPTITAALTAIRTCRTERDLTLLLKGTFTEGIDLKDITPYMNGYTLTITSYNGDTNSAIISPSSGAGITLGNTRNVVLKNITVNVTSGSPGSTNLRYAMHFTAACSNIVVKGCRLLANSTTTSTYSAAVYKASETGIVDSIFFINNVLDGGYYGFYFNGSTGTGLYGSNVVFDSNTVSNSCYYGTYPYYLNFTSCSYNTVLSRTTSTSSTWYGLCMDYTNGPAIGNRIIQRSNSITSPYGIYLNYYNYYPTAIVPDTSLVANNEIILNTTGAYYGIYANYAKAKILHNSIYISGTGMARGIHIVNSAYNYLVIKNNNIVTTFSSAYPVYFSATGNITRYDIDYNNYYAPNNIGYYGADITMMPIWQLQIPTDFHSITVLPDFVNVSSNLRLANYGELLCNGTPFVSNDIDGKNRLSLTTIGCYDGVAAENTNAMLETITGLREGEVLAQTDTVKMTIYNTGTTPINTVTLEWSINGISQNTGGTPYTVSLANREQSATVTLGIITYPAGKVDVKVWIKELNGGAAVDGYKDDDTVSKSVYVCSSPFNGLLTVGQSVNSNFKTIGEVWKALSVCGVNGDLTIAVEPGIYEEDIDLSNRIFEYTVTITSTINNADSVIVRPSEKVGVIFNNSKNIILKNITVDARISKLSAIQFMGACTNITVRDCKLLTDTTTTSSNVCPVYKASGTGIVDSIFFINNLLDGGYYGFYFYGGTSNTAYGSNVIFDSNTVSKSYSSGTYPYYVSFVSCSHNTILSRTANTTSSWYGLRMDNTNGPAIGNRIIQRSNAITSPYGIYLNYYNYYPTAIVPDTSFVVNNEIILYTTGAYYGIYATYARAKILHNSIYISGTGAGRGIHIQNGTGNYLVIKNNNIVLTSSSAYPVYFSAAGNLELYNIDYNNYYAPTNIGYYESARTTLTDWQGQITSDQHSVRTEPLFIAPSVSLEFSANNDSLLCPVIENILSDIKGYERPPTGTAMGAYTQLLAGQDLTLQQVSPWNPEVINNQVVPVNVNVSNTGLVPITHATIGWSVNDSVQTSFPWTANPPLASREQRNITVGTFTALNEITFDIVVWIETVNGQLDSNNRNDTVFATAVISPLAEFVAPFVDTVDALDFDVSAKIRSTTGAPVSSPNLYIETILNSYILYDTISMVLHNDTWQAHIPQQYYNSKVIYSLTVSDAIGNTFTAIDSVYIQAAELSKTDTVIIGWGSSSAYYMPISMGTAYGWSRQIYLYREVCPSMPSAGIYITKMAWQSITANAFYANQTCYMRAISDTIEVTGYLDPHVVGSGVSQVWADSLAIYPGWVEITLDTPFFLPVGKNLEIIWEHQNGFTNNHYSDYWAHTQMQNIMTVYAVNDPAFPPTAGQLSYYRPNIKITTESALKQSYTGKNLSLTSFLSPVDDIENLCATDYMPVRVVVGNTGELDYDFSVDTVALHFEIIDPKQIQYTGYIPVYTGTLAVGKANIIELMAALPIYPGRYELKVWMESPVDNVVYDNKLDYVYISRRVGLPVNADFNRDIPAEFITQAVNTSAQWRIVSQGSGSDSVVKPFSGSGMLAFTGDKGAVTHLSTRQLSLGGTTFPTLEFWYFHDTIKSNDYTDVRITTDGGVTYTCLLSLRKQNAVYGWQYYSADLTPYINGECILLLFEAMRMDAGVGSQYIDSIAINSQADLEVSKIALPLQTACDLKNAQLEVILSTTTNQVIDLSDFSTNLVIDTSGYPFLSIPLQNRIEGLSSDTIRIPVPNLPAGNHTVKAYLSSPVDNLPADDTAHFSVNIQPALSVTVNSLTDGVYCFRKGTPVQQEIILQNTGTLDLQGIEFSLLITGDNTTQMVKETKTVDLSVGKSTSYTFENVYTAPAEVTYQVQVFAWLGCDSVLVNATHATQECVDMNNISIAGLDNPVNDKTDTAGTMENIVVVIANESDNKRYSNINATALIEDENGQMLGIRMGSISMIEPLDTVQFTFTEPYTVPNDSVYYIRVYINSQDNTPEDDTLTIKRTVVKDKDLSLVNIYNPLSEMDVIGRSVQVIASLHNSSKNEDFAGINITVRVENSQRQLTANFTETIDVIGRLSTITYTFGNSYAVPKDSLYYLIVYTDSYDDNPDNDTLKFTRYTESVGIALSETVHAFMLGQNIPNPANSITRIDYSIPDAGEIIFHVHSITGQLLYSKTIESKHGINSIELNTSTFAAGVYFYSMEYKGQKRVKQLIIPKCPLALIHQKSTDFRRINVAYSVYNQTITMTMF
jgi:hypothetical protein